MAKVLEIVSLQEMKCRIGPMAKLDCFCTQKKIKVFTFRKPKRSVV